MSAAQLEIWRIAKRFQGVVAVDQVSFTVRAGEVTGLIGPNGSGKTTFFNLVTGMVAPDAGEVVFHDRHIEGQTPHRIARSGIGRTFQVTRVFPRMTALENLLVAVRRAGLRELLRSALRGREVERAEQWLERVGLEHLRDAEARSLSFGQQKLLELAGAMMGDPQLVLLDEPAGGINPVMIERISSLVRELNDEGRTFLVVEHNMDMVMSTCDHVIVFDRGRPIAEGSPSEIQADERVLEAYLGV
jgi:ABC-type branched-subunit amino acid transport system ATPase component